MGYNMIEINEYLISSLAESSSERRNQERSITRWGDVTLWVQMEVALEKNWGWYYFSSPLFGNSIRIGSKDSSIL